MEQRKEKARTARMQRATALDHLENLQSLIDKPAAFTTISKAEIELLTRKTNQVELEFNKAHFSLLEVIEEGTEQEDLLEAKMFDKRIQAIQLFTCTFTDKLDQTQQEKTLTNLVSPPKLPDLPLVNFTGEYEDWDNFYDMFEAWCIPEKI